MGNVSVGNIKRNFFTNRPCGFVVHVKRARSVFRKPCQKVWSSPPLFASSLAFIQDYRPRKKQSFHFNSFDRKLFLTRKFSAGSKRSRTISVKVEYGGQSRKGAKTGGLLYTLCYTTRDKETRWHMKDQKFICNYIYDNKNNNNFRQKIIHHGTKAN